MKKESSLNTLTPDATFSQIVRADEYAGELLASIGLKPSSYKNQTLRSVCKQRQWSEVEVLRWVKKQSKKVIGKPEEKLEITDFGENLSEWCEYLKDEFHTANLELLEEIKKDFPRVYKIHANQYPWLKNMKWTFEEFDEALKMYYEFESKKFYPLVKSLYKVRGDLLHGTIRKLERCLTIVEQDQQRLQRFMKTLTKKGNSFESPGNACSTMRILNQNFKTLFANINSQFEIETKELLPGIEKKMEAVY